MNQVFSLYHEATGRFTGTVLTMPKSMLAASIPAGQQAIEGAHDRLTSCVIDGLVVPLPADEAAALTAAAADRQRLRLAIAAAKALESQQARAVRALMIDPTDAAARAILRSIEERIASLGLRSTQ